MASSDFCLSGTPDLRDDCQSCLKEVERITSLAIDAAIKAQTGADPVSELIARQIIERLQSAYSLTVQLRSARNAQ